MLKYRNGYDTTRDNPEVTNESIGRAMKCYGD